MFMAIMFNEQQHRIQFFFCSPGTLLLVSEMVPVVQCDVCGTYRVSLTIHAWSLTAARRGIGIPLSTPEVDKRHDGRVLRQEKTWHSAIVMLLRSGLRYVWAVYDAYRQHVAQTSGRASLATRRERSSIRSRRCGSYARDSAPIRDSLLVMVGRVSIARSALSVQHLLPFAVSCRFVVGMYSESRSVRLGELQRETLV